MTQQELIARELERRGMSWYALAKQTGIQEATFSRFRSKHFNFIRPDIIHTLADTLDLDADTLYIAGNHIPPDVHKVLIDHPQLLQVIRNLAKKLAPDTPSNT